MDKQHIQPLARTAVEQSGLPRRYWTCENFKRHDWTLQLQTLEGALAEEVTIEIRSSMTDEEIVAGFKKELLALQINQ